MSVQQSLRKGACLGVTLDMKERTFLRDSPSDSRCDSTSSMLLKDDSGPGCGGKEDIYGAQCGYHTRPLPVETTEWAQDIRKSSVSLPQALELARYAHKIGIV